MASYFLVKFNNLVYANGELYSDVIAKGERAFRKMLVSKTVVGESLLGQIMYPVTPKQQEICKQNNPVFQDFDDAIRHFNIVPKEILRQIKLEISEAFYKSVVISIDKNILSERFKYKHLTFFRASDWDYRERGKYHALSKMATVKICGYLYVALNTVDVRVKEPIIAALKD